MDDIKLQWLNVALGVRPGAPSSATAQDAAVPKPARALRRRVSMDNEAPIDTARFDTNPTGLVPGDPVTPPTEIPELLPLADATQPVTPPEEIDPAVMERHNELADRYNAIAEPDVTADMIEANRAFLAHYDLCEAALDAGQSDVLSGLLDGMEARVVRLEALQARLPALVTAATVEASRIAGLSDKEVAKLPAADRADAIRKLLAAGKPTGAVRAAQIRLYNSAKLDKTFVEADHQRAKAIGRELKGDTELKDARKGWRTASEEDKLAALRKVVAVQSRHLGIPAPEMVIEHKPPANGLVTNGFFSPADGKLHINMDPASSVQNFQKAVDLAIHENAHNWQAWLVGRLKSGDLGPGDPEYAQTLMFAVNEIHPGGYITGEEDYAAYKKQPLEDHSWTTGPDTAKAIIKGL